jgi:hypothetical protein
MMLSDQAMGWPLLFLPDDGHIPKVKWFVEDGTGPEWRRRFAIDDRDIIYRPAPEHEVELVFLDRMLADKVETVLILAEHFYFPAERIA